MQEHIVVREVSKTYQTASVQVPAVDRITLTVFEQEFLTILGPSGCGKSTLLGMVGGLVKPPSLPGPRQTPRNISPLRDAAHARPGEDSERAQAPCSPGPPEALRPDRVSPTPLRSPGGLSHSTLG